MKRTSRRRVALLRWLDAGDGLRELILSGDVSKLDGFSEFVEADVVVTLDVSIEYRVHDGGPIDTSMPLSEIQISSVAHLDRNSCPLQVFDGVVDGTARVE